MSEQKPYWRWDESRQAWVHDPLDYFWPRAFAVAWLIAATAFAVCLAITLIRG